MILRTAECKECHKVRELVGEVCSSCAKKYDQEQREKKIKEYRKELEVRITHKLVEVSYSYKGLDSLIQAISQVLAEELTEIRAQIKTDYSNVTDS